MSILSILIDPQANMRLGTHSGLPSVIEYIRSQPEHHQKLSYRQELEQFFAKHGIEYDTRFFDSE